MVLIHSMTAPPAPAKAAQSTITPLEGPLAATRTTLPWVKTRPPKPGSGSGRDIGETAYPFFLHGHYLKSEGTGTEIVYLVSIQICWSSRFLQLWLHAKPGS